MHKDKTIILAADNSGFKVKEAVKLYLESNDYIVKDLTLEANDYYFAGYEAGAYISKEKGDMAIVICGNGYGIGYAASMHENVFVSNCANVSQAKSARAVNDANVLAMGGNIVTNDVAVDITEAFLKTKFGQGLPSDVVTYLSNSFKELKKLKK